MRKGQLIVILAALLSATRYGGAESPAVNNTESGDPGASSVAVTEPPQKSLSTDPCTDPELQPNTMPPTWNIQALGVQCGALETDNLAVLEPMGNGVTQWTLGTMAKYGLTPRVQLRWGLPGRISQHGSGTRPVIGITDQAVGLLYHFRNAGGWMPDLSLDYGLKIPSANPSKAFGSGYADHVGTLVASRDLGSNHVDFNVAGTVAGGPRAFDPAIQVGLGYTRTFAHNLMGTVEVFGGSQPGTGDRLGAVSMAGAWGIRPWLALNGGCFQSYTAGSPRSQLMLGFIYTMRPMLRFGRMQKR